MTDHQSGRAEFAAHVRETFPEEFALFWRTLTVLEDAIDRRRPVASLTEIAIDMLMLQAYKSAVSVHEVALLGHLEDAATLARRLMDLGVQMAYISIKELAPHGEGNPDPTDLLSVEERAS